MVYTDGNCRHVRAGPVSARCWQHLPDTGPVLTHFGMLSWLEWPTGVGTFLQIRLQLSLHLHQGCVGRQLQQGQKLC